MIKIGILIPRSIRRDINRAVAIAERADQLGFESLWLSDRLIMPANLEDRLDAVHAKAESQVFITDPAYDALAYLCFLAGRTRRIRLGVGVWQMALRHPFITARAIQTLDLLSEGRSEIGLGAGWLSSEYEAVGVEFASRGRRLDETITICQRLWSEPVVKHSGEFYEFDSVIFDPKPKQQPWPRLHAGGESRAALRRASRLDGWFGRTHTPDSVVPFVRALADLRRESGLSNGQFDITVRIDAASLGDVTLWERAGVTRVCLAAWEPSDDPLGGLERIAQRYGLDS